MRLASHLRVLHLCFAPPLSRISLLLGYTMSSFIRILIADPSASLRRMVVAATESQSDMQVCGSAETGRDAIEQFRKQATDVIILNTNLPVLDTLATIRELRKLNSNVPILVFCTANVRGSEVTLKALEAGANDFVARPTAAASTTVMDFLEAHLLPAIRNWHRRASLRGVNPDALLRLKKSIKGAMASTAVSPNARASSKTTVKHAIHRPEVIVIGSSTGGPKALSAVLRQFPKSLSLPIVIVQHMPAMFTRMLAQQLEDQCAVSVAEATDGVPLTPGHVLLAPGGSHLKLIRRMGKVVTQLSHDPPEISCRPAVDVLFRSAASVYGSGSLAVVLTGMGADGTAGCRDIKQAGGSVIVQERHSCVVWGMPRSVEEAGLADAIVPLDGLGNFIHRTVLSPLQSSVAD